jgi:hypothetical protein
MPDSPSLDAERLLQRIFRKASLFNALTLGLMAGLILAAHCWLAAIPNRQDRPHALAEVRFTPAGFTPAGFAPLKFAGAWKVEIADSRFGGVSALAIDGNQLIALTDSGTVIRFPKPGMAGLSLVHDLSDGPGRAGFKKNRDSEALARDPVGRGWWVAFENWDQLWLYDSAFRNVLRRIDLGRERWKANKGVEAMVADQNALIIFPEAGGEWLEVRDRAIRSRPIFSRYGYISDAARLPDGRLLLVTRQFGPAGIAKQLVVAEESDGEVSLRPLASLGLGATDNVEAIAAEPRANGTRLWLMTDNDFRARAPTYLVALDLP